MSQVNLHTTPQFEDDLVSLMLWRGITSKADAIRYAVHEAAARHRVAACRTVEDFVFFLETMPQGVLDGPAGPVLKAEIGRAMRKFESVDAVQMEGPDASCPDAP
jgi:hypothetical protein